MSGAGTFLLSAFCFQIFHTAGVLPRVRAPGVGRRNFMVLLFALLASVVSGQEALRVSLAGQDMAEAKKRSLAGQRFNVMMGPVALRLSSSLGIEASDNIRGEATHPQADLVLRPQLNTLSVWRVTEQNSLTFGLGIGYQKYLRTSQYDNFFITPDSDLSFDIYIGDVAINLHDRFHYTQDVSADPTVSGTGSLSRFENTAGITATWDLNKAVLTLGYDHNVLVATEKRYEYLTHSAELFTATAAFKVTPTLLAGLQTGGGLTDYDQNALPDNNHISAGPFVSAQLTEYTSLRIVAGYATYAFDAQSTTNTARNASAFYADVALQQRVGNLLAHSVSLGRSIQSGLTSDILDTIYLRYAANWNLLRLTSLNTSISFEHVTQPGTQQEAIDRYGFGFGVGRTLTRKLTASLNYQFYYRISDLPGRDYVQNRLVLDMVYAF